jgi:hypothetical protein
VGNGLIKEIEPTNEELRWYAIQKRARRARAELAFELFRAANIEPILIKGLAAAANYPPNIPRNFNDTDLAVSGQDFERARELCATERFVPLTVDLHRELRDLDTRPWAELVERSQLVDGIRILSPEDHLRVMCSHWLLDGGANQGRLWDIYYAVKNRPDNFDWTECFSGIPEHRRKWIVYTIGVAADRLGLELAGLPIAEEAANVPRWMLRCIDREWRSGRKIAPVAAQLYSPRELFRQIQMRLPPNPIRSTIEMDGDLDAPYQLKYQIGTMFNMMRHPRGQHRSAAF